MGVNCPLWPTATPSSSCRKLEFRLSALMDSNLAWVNGKSGPVDKADAMLTLSSAL